MHRNFKKSALYAVGPGRDPAPEQLDLHRTVAGSYCKNNISIVLCTKNQGCRAMYPASWVEFETPRVLQIGLQEGASTIIRCKPQYACACCVSNRQFDIP